MSSQLSEAPGRALNPRQLETVEHLLAAGLVELRAAGHEALTIRTVAQRAGVSPATAYTYLSSKHHLFAELFWRHLAAGAEPDRSPAVPTVARVQSTVRSLVARIVEEPELAAAVTPALLGSDPDVARLRMRIGAELLRRFELALAGPGGDADPVVLDVLVLTLSGALLHAGMGLMTYDEMSERLVPAVAVILGGRR